MLYTRLRNTLLKIPNVSRYLKDLGLPAHFVGLRYFLRGKFQKPSKTAMNAILDSVDYEIIEIPVKKDNEELKQELSKISEDFFEDLEKNIEKYKNDKKKYYMSSLNKTNSVEKNLKNLDTTKPVEVDGVPIDIGIEIDDLF